MVTGKKNLVAIFVLLFGVFLTNVNGGDYEFSPFIGHAAGGSFDNTDTGDKLDLEGGTSFGFILGMKDNSREGAMYELFYMHQANSIEGDGVAFSGASEIDLDIDYVHVGGTYGAEVGKIQPFVSGGLGITYMNPEKGDSEIKPSLSLGAGMKIPITDHIKLRFEGRGFGTLFSRSSTVFCHDGGCEIETNGEMFLQFSVFSGVTINF